MEYSLSDIFGIDVVDEQKYLDETKQDGLYQFHLEVTINYPRIASFTKKTRQLQEQYLKSLLMYIKVYCRFVQNIRYSIEECRDGTPHIHALLECGSPKLYSPWGVVSMVVDCLKSQMNRRTQNLMGYYHYSHKFLVFKSPPICVAWVSCDDKKRRGVWEEYINKFSQTKLL